MRAISIILLCGAYASLLPYGAEWISDSFRHCMRMSYGGLPWLGLGIGYFLLRGYGECTVERLPTGLPRIFWASSVGFNLGIFSMAVTMCDFHEITRAVTSRFTELHQVLDPTAKADGMLEALAGMAWVYSILWTPLAALLSMAAFILTCMDRRTPMSNNGAMDAPCL